jgi:hypothetical protein
MSYPTDPLESPWKYDGTYQARHLALLDLIRIAAGSGGGGGYDFDLLNQEATQMLIKTVLDGIDTKLPQLTLNGDSLKVFVNNQIDLTTITSYLLDIKNSVAAIDTNTDGIEGLITDTITAINNGTTSINGNLTDIITELQGLDANTDGLETVLTDILNKIIAAPATEATQLLIKAKTDNLDVALSTRLNTLGQKTAANSTPVVLASDQILNVLATFTESFIGSTGVSKAKVKFEIGETLTIDSSSQLTYKDAITFFTNLGTIDNQGVLRFDSLDEFINEGTILNDNLIILD